MVKGVRRLSSTQANTLLRQGKSISEIAKLLHHNEDAVRVAIINFKEGVICNG